MLDNETISTGECAMLTQEDRERIEFLEAKVYFEESLSPQEEAELDNLIAKANN